MFVKQRPVVTSSFSHVPVSRVQSVQMWMMSSSRFAVMKMFLLIPQQREESCRHDSCDPARREEPDQVRFVLRQHTSWVSIIWRSALCSQERKRVRVYAGVHVLNIIVSVSDFTLTLIWMSRRDLWFICSWNRTVITNTKTSLSTLEETPKPVEKPSADLKLRYEPTRRGTSRVIRSCTEIVQPNM